MDLTNLIPYSDPLPLSPDFFWVLLQGTTVLHFLFMNALLGGGLILLVEAIKVRGQSAPPPLGKELYGKLPYTVAFTVNLGVPPLLFAQVIYGQFLYTSTVMMAGLWLSIFLLIIGTYYSYYYYFYKHHDLDCSRFWPLLLACATLLLVGFFFSNNISIMQTVGNWKDYFADKSGTLINWKDASLIPRYLHMVLAALAVGGLFLAIVAWFKKQRGEVNADERIRVGLNYFGAATIANFLIGGIFLATLPNQVVAETFSSKLALLCMLGSALFGLISVVLAFGRLVWPATCATIITILLMTLVRDWVRQAYLSPYFKLDSLPVNPQYGPAALFIIVLIGGLAVLYYMLRLVWNQNKEVAR
jgi:hypothetical protein